MLSRLFASFARNKRRVVLDTNVLISATLAEKGFSAMILRAVRHRQIDLIISPYILAEYSNTIRRPHIANKYQDISERGDAIIRFLNVRATTVTPESVDRVVADDPKDDAILACAKEGGANYIVSGDEHLVAMNEYLDIEILTPREFVEPVLREKTDL